METIDILEEISRSKQYDIALFTTFNFEIGFFEHFILNTLNNNGIRKVSVYADAGQFSAALEDVKDCSVGKRYVVNPISIDGAFHPKLILLLGENQAKLFVSSANLTLSGYCRNNEIVNVFIFDETHPETLKLISQAISFFERLDQLSYGLDKDLLQEVRMFPYYGRSNENSNIYLLDNLNTAILQQVSEMVPGAVSIDIAVPYYDNGLQAVEQVYSFYPEAQLNLYVQNGKSRFPMEKNADPRFTVHPFQKIRLAIGDGIKEDDRFYHGKVIRFSSDTRSFILYGSTNCTAAALCKSFRGKGNIECDILEIGAQNEFDTYFDGFIRDSTELKCEHLEYVAPKNTNVWFKYGVGAQNRITLHFGFAGHFHVAAVYLQDKQVPFSSAAGEIRITIPSDQFDVDSEIFDVVLDCSDGLKKIRCWVIFKDNLALYRLPEKTDDIFSFSQESTGDKFIEDRIALIQAFALSVEEQDRELEIRRYFREQAEEIDAENSDDEDGGIIDYIPPSVETIRQYKIIKEVEKIEIGYRRMFRDKMHALEELATTANKSSSSSPAVISSARAVSEDDEKNFVRFVKTNCRKMLSMELIAKFQPPRYLSRVLAFFECIDKYSVCMLSEGETDKREAEPFLLSADFATDIKTKMLLKLLDMDLVEEDRKVTTVLTFMTILSNHRLEPWCTESNTNNLNQKLLFKIEQDDEFRQKGYIELVFKAIDMWQDRGLSFTPVIEINYVDSLFGYKPLQKIRESLKADYGNDAYLKIENDEIQIITNTAKMKNYMKIPEGSMYDINNYVKKKGTFHRFSAIIRYTGAPKGPDPAMTIIYDATKLPAVSVKQTIVRKSGKKEVRYFPVASSSE